MMCSNFQWITMILLYSSAYYTLKTQNKHKSSTILPYDTELRRPHF